ncbi:MAG: WD40 repeat domain-containing protein [Chloroflexi bacterium]|nr:WD40 repeat domain-containing protein [Chloroflexota bacterium]
MRRLISVVSAVLLLSIGGLSFAQDRGIATAIDWSPDGDTIAVVSSTGLWLFDTDFNEVGFVDIGLTEWWHWPASLEWNAAGNLLAVGYPRDRYPGISEIQIIDVDKLEVITEISLGYLDEWLWTEVAWHPSDNHIAAGGYWGKSIVLDALSGMPVFQFEPSDWPEEAPPNTTIAVCWFTESVIAFMHKKETFVVDVELKKTLYSFETYLWLPPDCHKDYKILNHRGYLVDAKTGAYVDAFEDIAIDPADIVIPLERDDWEPTQYFEFSPDRSRILRAAQGCRLRLYDGHNGNLLAKFPGGIFLVEDFGATIFRDSLAWRADGSQFAAVGQFGGIRVWDAETYKLLRRYDGFEVSFPALSESLLGELNEQELKLIDSLKNRCIKALNSELPEG